MNTDAHTNVRDVARTLIDGLPENATWDDVMYRMYVRQAIEAGLADMEAGRLTDHADVCKKYGLPE